MKLRIKGFDEDIKIQKDISSLVAIQNQKLFSNIVKMLYEYNHLNIRELAFLNKENEIISNKKIIVINDIFNLSFNNRTILSKLYNIIKNNLEEDVETYYEMKRLINSLNNLVVNSLENWNFDMDFCEENEIECYLKAMDFKLHEIDSFVDKIITLLEIYSELFPDTCIIFLHILDYMDDNEIAEVLKYICYKKVYVLFIENDLNRDYLFDYVFLIDNEFDVTSNANDIQNNDGVVTV